MGRLARYIGSDKHLLISPQRITLVFVISDISTFLVQVRDHARIVSPQLTFLRIAIRRPREQVYLSRKISTSQRSENMSVSSCSV